MKDYIQSHIDSITPYYFVINNEFKVVEAGKTVLFSHPILIGKEFQYTFFLEDIEYEGVTPVSYTHLTLPTILRV